MKNDSGLLRLNTYLALEREKNRRMPFSPNFLAALFLSLTFIGNTGLAQVVIEGNKGSRLKASAVAQFKNPWAIDFLSETQLLVTTKPGLLWIVSPNGRKQKVQGLPEVAFGGQGGLGDVVAHPQYKKNGLIYLSYIEEDKSNGTKGAVVIRGTLDLKGRPILRDIKRIWTQLPKMQSEGHYSHRLAFGPAKSVHQGKLFISSGDRQYQTPAQRWDMALGKIIRLDDDGTLPADNPFQDKGELAKSYWSLGHRNALGLAFDQKGRLWSHEMGPKDGDELNLIEKGANYGWPVVSEGTHYSGTEIPAHYTRPEFNPPKVAWVPTIAPSGLVIYSGAARTNWDGDAFIGGLRSRALLRIDIDGTEAKEAERFTWGQRIRDVKEGPNGTLWVIEDGPKGRLIKLLLR